MRNWTEGVHKVLKNTDANTKLIIQVRRGSGCWPLVEVRWFERKWGGSWTEVNCYRVPKIIGMIVLGHLVQTLVLPCKGSRHQLCYPDQGLWGKEGEHPVKFSSNHFKQLGKLQAKELLPNPPHNQEAAVTLESLRRKKYINDSKLSAGLWVPSPLPLSWL